VDLVGLKPTLRNTTSFSALTLLVGSFDPQKPSPKWPIMTLNPTHFTSVLLTHNSYSCQGSCRSLNFFSDLQGLETPWKETRSLKVLESLSKSPWIWFFIQWLNKWLSVSHYCYLLIFCKQVVATTMVFMLVLETRTLRVKLRTVNWTCADVLIKMLLWVNAVLLEYRKCGPWKWFLHQEPCFCCCMTPYILQSLWFGFAG